MASSPSSMYERRNRPGCMSGIAHLFDFNQAVTGKKLLTDKKYGAGIETQRNVSDDDMERFMSKTGTRGKIEFVKSASVSGRSGDVPIKALIADDVSQELGSADEPKSRAPNVVARLMGLDALPWDGAGQSRQVGMLENSVRKVHSERLQHGNSTVFSSSRASKNGGPPMRSVSDLSSFRRSRWEEYTPTFESLSTRSHTHKEEFNSALDCQTDWKPDSQVQMQTLDDLDVQLAAKQMLIKQKLSEAKLGLLAESNAPQEKLYESKEFMDAMDFLQANKDFFARFLEEPHSLFAKHLRSSDEKSSWEKVMELRNHSKRHSLGPPDHGIIAENKDPPDLWRSSFRQSERSSQIDERVSIDDRCRQERALKTQQKNAKSLQFSVSNSEESYQSPTRIVVLKPGPGKVRNLRSLTPSSPSSPTEFLDAIEIVKKNNIDVLRDLRCKLQQEDAIDLKKTWTSISEDSKLVRDPREIARKIARQVRENVMKDMKANAKGGIISETGWDRNKVPNVDNGGIYLNHNGSLDLRPRDPMSETLSSLSSNLFDRKASPNRVKGVSRRSLEHIFLEKSVAQTLGPHGADRRRHPQLRDYGCHDKQGGRRFAGLGVHEVTSINTGDIHPSSETEMECDTDSHSQSVWESEAETHARNQNTARITLLRSRSVPTSASFHRRLEKRGVVRDRTFPASKANVEDVKLPFDVAIHQKVPFRPSVSRQKRVGSNSVLSKGNPVAKGSWKTSIPMQELPRQKFNSNVGSVYEKVQHQIDDSGPVLDSDSSVSSLDDGPSLESALMTGGVSSGKLLASASCMQTMNVNTIPSEAKSLSSEGSPSKSLNSTDVEHMCVDPELSKELPEQPSPVSVLDVPFHEGPSSPMDFTEISSGLQELGARLQLLKFGEQEAEALSIQEEYQEDSKFTDETQSATELSHPVFSIENIKSSLDGVLCPKEKLPEFMYVQKLLIASGFTIDRATVLTRWHLPSQPLATSVFEVVENGHRGVSHDIEMNECELRILTQHLLFDSVNEVLLQVLGPYVSCHNFWKWPQVSSKMPLGEDLVRQVWSRIHKLLSLHSEDQGTLGSLIETDLATKDRWHDFSLDREIVVLEVEKAIWDDLLGETLCNYYLLPAAVLNKNGTRQNA